MPGVACCWKQCCAWSLVTVAPGPVSDMSLLAKCSAKQRGPELSGLPSAELEEASWGQPLLIPTHFLRVFRGHVKLQIFVATLERKHGSNFSCD